MCWSGEASAAIAIGGLTSAYYLKKRGEPAEVYLPVAYFVLMEGLQAFTYIWVDDCGTTPNKLLTYLGMFHIAFQPFFVNMLGLHFIDPEVKKRIQGWVYVICGVATISCLMRLIPAYETFGVCELGTPMCSHVRTCAYSGEWHIGWDVLINGFNEYWLGYLFVAFGVPLLYGSWRWVGYHFVVGPLAAAFTTSDVSERPAVWCLFSTCIIALLINTRLRRFAYVKSFPGWNWLRTRPIKART